MLDLRIDIALIGVVYNEFFDAPLPEVHDENQHTHFTILEALFPAQDKLYLALFTRLGNKPFPEARRVGGGNLNGGPMRYRWIPAWINLCSFESNERAACLFTDTFIGAQFIDSNQDISSVAIVFFRQRLEQGQLARFRHTVDVAQYSFCLFLAGTAMQVTCNLVKLPKQVLYLRVIFL